MRADTLRLHARGINLWSNIIAGAAMKVWTLVVYKLYINTVLHPSRVNGPIYLQEVTSSQQSHHSIWENWNCSGGDWILPCLQIILTFSLVSINNSVAWSVLLTTYFNNSCSSCSQVCHAATRMMHVDKWVKSWSGLKYS